MCAEYSHCIVHSVDFLKQLKQLQNEGWESQAHALRCMHL